LLIYQEAITREFWENNNNNNEINIF